MPSWQPDWTDVVFDHEAAAAAVAAAEALAGALRRSLGQRPALLDRVHHDWAGPARAGFDRQVGRLVGEESGLEAALRALARSLVETAREATLAQAARVADRARWRQEAAAEQLTA